jgi:hypothetical protein
MSKGLQMEAVMTFGLTLKTLAVLALVAGTTLVIVQSELPVSTPISLLQHAQTH